MNRINCYHMCATTYYLWYIHFTSRNTITEPTYRRAIKEARVWCAIKETIRKGYKRVIE